MKYTKERQFVKEACEQLKEEVIVSRIKIIESGFNENKLYYVLYEDRFERLFQIFKENNNYSRHEVLKADVERTLKNNCFT